MRRFESCWGRYPRHLLKAALTSHSAVRPSSMGQWPGGRPGNTPGRLSLSAASGQAAAGWMADWQGSYQVSPGQDTGGRPA